MTTNESISMTKSVEPNRGAVVQAAAHEWKHIATPLTRLGTEQRPESFQDGWKSEYREAYEVAKGSNAVVKAAVARVLLDSGTDVVKPGQIRDLVMPAVRAGFPPALVFEFLFQFFHEEPLSKAGLDDLTAATLVPATVLGCSDALCLSAIIAYSFGSADPKTLLNAVRNADACILLAVAPVVVRFMKEAEEADETLREMDETLRVMDETLRRKEEEADELRQQMTMERDQHRRNVESTTSRIHGLKHTNVELSRQVAALSESSLKRTTDDLNAEMETMKRGLADAKAQMEETKASVAAKIADSVRDLRGQAERYQMERDIAGDERDEALRQVETLNRTVKHLQACVRRNGLDPFACGDREAEPDGTDRHAGDHVETDARTGRDVRAA